MLRWLYDRMLGIIHPRVIQALGWIMIVGALYLPYRTLLLGALKRDTFYGFIFNDAKDAFYHDFLGQGLPWFLVGLFFVFVASAIVFWRKRARDLERENERLWHELRNRS